LPFAPLGLAPFFPSPVLPGDNLARLDQLLEFRFGQQLAPLAAPSFRLFSLFHGLPPIPNYYIQDLSGVNRLGATLDFWKKVNIIMKRTGG
jgi:hypothetical protein